MIPVDNAIAIVWAYSHLKLDIFVALERFS